MYVYLYSYVFRISVYVFSFMLLQRSRRNLETDQDDNKEIVMRFFEHFARMLISSEDLSSKRSKTDMADTSVHGRRAV